MQGNVNIEITFQHYDSEWQEYIDINDDSVVSKEKLKVVVSPKLQTPVVS